MINLVSDKPHYENVPFELPESWEWVTLGAIGTWQAGGTPNRGVKEYYGGDIPWLKTGDLNDGYITNIPECITKLGLDKSSAKLNPKDSVLIAMYGATIGKVGILTFPATTNQACCACIEYPAVDKLYLYYFLLSHREIFISRGGGGAQPNISKEIILATQFPLPPHAEQQRIVAEVEKWFTLIDTLEENKEDLKDYIKQVKSKVLSLAISGKLVPQDPNDEPAIELLKRINPNFKSCDTSHYKNLPFDIPLNWVWVKHNDVISVIGGAQPPKSNFKSTPQEGYVRLYQIRDYGTSPVPVYIPIEMAQKTTKKGDVLLARYGASLGKVFFAEEGAYNVAMAKAELKYDNIIERDFIYYYYLSDIYQTKLKSISRTAQAGFNATDLSELYLPIPPLSEQRLITEKIKKVFFMLETISAEL